MEPIGSQQWAVGKRVGTSDEGRNWQLTKKIAVIIVAHGEAETAGFMDNFAMTRYTLAHASEVMRIPKPLQFLISLGSGLKNRSRFNRINYVSPHNSVTRKQVSGISGKLARHPERGSLSFEVFPAFSATPPFVEDVIGNTCHYDARIMLYMSPVENRLACGSICSFLTNAYKDDELANVKVVSRFWQDKALLGVYLDHIFRHADCNSKVGADKPVLVLAFHGTLVADTKGFSPSFHTGQEETAVFAETLRMSVMNDARNPFGHVVISYLNHDVGGKWTMPSLEQVLDELKAGDAGHVVLFSAGYFAEGNETILRAKQALEKSGIGTTTYISCLNDSDAFVEVLADRVVVAAQQVMNLSLSPC